MKIKHAIGITVNGNEVRAAFLSLVRGKARIKALESIKLDMPIENIDSKIRSAPDSLNDLENAFDIKEPELSKDEQQEETTNNEGDQNVSKVYALLDKFHNLKANIAINAPHLTVKYDFIEKEQVPSKKNRLKEKIDIWGGEVEHNSRGMKYMDAVEGKVLKVDYEFHPPVIDLMEEVNQFRANNLNLALMDTNELALIDLVKEIYKFEKDEITAIIYVEQDFSRVIFLKGKDIYHITPILHKGSMSDDVLEVLYSRMIFAQDQYFIPEINKILVAGHSSRLKAKYYFRQKFPSAITGYLNSRKIQSDLRFKDRGLLFSRYAVPIALAWKALIKNAIKSKEKNFLPDYILERQTMPKLAIHGYFILFLLTATALLFTWALVSKNLEIRKVTRSIEVMSQQIENNKTLTEQVHSYDSQIMDIERKIALVDSFSKGYEETSSFMQSLNKSIRKTGDIWITELKKSGSKVNITGLAKRRDKIPIIANALGGADLKKVTRSTFMGTGVFTFHLDKKLDEDDSKRNLTIFSFLRDRNTQGKQRGNRQSKHRGKNSTNGASFNGEKTSGNSHAKKTNGAVSEYVYGLQIGVYDTKDQARMAAKSYMNRGYGTTITRLNNNTKYSLIIGALSKIEKAQKLSDKLAQQLGISNKVVRFKR